MLNRYPLPEGGGLAFDFGQKRIGVAQGDSQVGIAHPIATVVGADNEMKFLAIARLIAEWQPAYLVVGLPVYVDGRPHELTRLAQKFGRRLYGRFGLPVYWVDERLSSVYAQSLLAEAGIWGRKQKVVLDRVAAQAILQSFFEEGAVAYFDGQISLPADAGGGEIEV